MDDELLSLIKCEYCNHIYDDPIMLPCNVTICYKHLLENDFKCINCDKIHGKDRNLHSTDKKALKLIEVNNKYINKEKINFGCNHQNAKVLIDELEVLNERIKPLIKNPTSYLDEFFNEIIKIHFEMANFDEILFFHGEINTISELKLEQVFFYCF